MIRYISEADVASCLTVPVTIGLLETAARDLAAGTASVAPRQRISSGPMRMNLLAGGCGGRIGHKCYPIMRPRGANFWVSLFGSDASLLAMIQANTLGQIRTGAASGLATKYMSRDDSTIVTIFGTGWQARTQLEAVCAVRPIERVYVIGRDPQHAQDFCAEMSAKLDISVAAATDSEKAVELSDIVILMTSATDPLLHGSMLKPGTHVNAAGSNNPANAEIDEKVVRRAGIVAVENIAQAKIESGDLLRAEQDGSFDWSRAVLISDIVAGITPGRTSPDEITLFESLGIGLWDIAAANYVYDHCVANGLGRDVDIPS